MIDISSGNLAKPNALAQGGLRGLFDLSPTNAVAQGGLRGLFEAPPTNALAGLLSAGGVGGMADRPTRPQDYLRRLSVAEIWRFILTHPDMDHLDGFDSLLREFTIHNFWHWGSEKEKPAFGGFNRYKEADWDAYERVRAGQERINSRLVHAGDTFAYANRTDVPGGRSDGLQILAPTPELAARANATEDPNDGSYVILYRADDFRFVFAGDSHDATWEHILANQRADVQDCDVLIAPHHGRDSGRSWDFLGVLRPKLTLFGVASSDHLAYDAWNSRGLTKFTNNQAGNVVLETSPGQLNVFVENESFAAQRAPGDMLRHGVLGYRRHGRITRQA